MRDTLAARALVLQSAGRRVAWVAVDLIAVDHTFTADVEARLHAAGVPELTLIVSASHTHSGPGSFVDSALLGWLALDRVDADVREALLGAVVAAIRQADAARGPARLAMASVTAPPLVRSRLRQPLDHEMLVVRVTGAQGEPIALLWNYAIHGTTLGARNLLLSGDVSPAGHGEGATVEIGAELALTAQAGWSSATPITRPTLAVGATTVALPPPRLSLRNCLRGWAPRGAELPLGSVLPRETRLTAVAVGDTGWVTFPGELQTSLGREIKTAAGAVRHPLVAGLSNDYLGYFVTPDEYDQPTYVSCGNLYGPETGSCLAAAAAALLNAVARGQGAPAVRVGCHRAAGSR
jgi:hypothetical protein